MKLVVFIFIIFYLQNAYKCSQCNGQGNTIDAANDTPVSKDRDPDLILEKHWALAAEAMRSLKEDRNLLNVGDELYKVPVIVSATVGLNSATYIDIAGRKKEPRRPGSVDYYWREYFGVIPPDAIQGGTDRAGKPTYVGQAYFRNFELLPATIYPGCKDAKASAYNKVMTTDKNIKILCAKDLSKYSWIATENDKTHLLTNCHFVIGGSEVGQTLNIARVNYEDETVIGKVFSHPLGNRGLWIPNSQGGETRFLSYELLTYNCANNLDRIGSA